MGLAEALCLIVSSIGKLGHWDATQKSSGNGKGLLQMHVSTTWVARNHTHVGRYDTYAVTQIGFGHWHPPLGGSHSN